jgi:hypothetical protein
VVSETGHAVAVPYAIQLGTGAFGFEFRFHSSSFGAQVPFSIQSAHHYTAAAEKGESAFSASASGVIYKYFNELS